jgi:hypothetical protein
MALMSNTLPSKIIAVFTSDNAPDPFDLLNNY